MSFLKVEGNKLELGRACTHPDYRNGRTMDLLWKGLAKYITLTNTRYLFGCSSVQHIDGDIVFSMVKGLEQKDRFSFEYNITPTADFAFPNQQELYDKATPTGKLLRELPALLRSYIHAGSKVYGFPAWDRDFRCTDMLTIMDIEQLTNKFRERYFPS